MSRLATAYIQLTQTGCVEVPCHRRRSWTVRVFALGLTVAVLSLFCVIASCRWPLWSASIKDKSIIGADDLAAGVLHGMHRGTLGRRDSLRQLWDAPLLFVNFGKLGTPDHQQDLPPATDLPNLVVRSLRGPSATLRFSSVCHSSPFHDAPDSDEQLCSVGENVDTQFIAETLLPTRGGNYRVRAYRHTVDGVTYSEPMAIIAGEPDSSDNVPVRVHDACFTSEVLGSLKCDCAEQLQMALAYIKKNGRGIVFYLPQEGRGIGLANKIAAYAMQETKLDTVDANRALGLPDDCREYTSVRNMLADMNIDSIQLITNNPRKIRLLTDLGVKVERRIPSIVAPNKVNKGYLAAKEKRMDHVLEKNSLTE